MYKKNCHHEFLFCSKMLPFFDSDDKIQFFFYFGWNVSLHTHTLLFRPKISEFKFVSIITIEFINNMRIFSYWLVGSQWKKKLKWNKIKRFKENNETNKQIHKVICQSVHTMNLCVWIKTTTTTKLNGFYYRFQFFLSFIHSFIYLLGKISIKRRRDGKKISSKSIGFWFFFFFLFTPYISIFLSICFCFVLCFVYLRFVVVVVGIENFETTLQQQQQRQWPKFYFSVFLEKKKCHQEKKITTYISCQKIFFCFHLDYITQNLIRFIHSKIYWSLVCIYGVCVCVCVYSVSHHSFGRPLNEWW